MHVRGFGDSQDSKMTFIGFEDGFRSGYSTRCLKSVLEVGIRGVRIVLVRLRGNSIRAKVLLLHNDTSRRFLDKAMIVLYSALLTLKREAP